jgi:hypothetical protein
VDAHELADAASGGGAGIGGRLHGSDVAAHDGRHQARIHFLPAHEDDVRRLHHRVCRLDHADKAARLDHAERVADVAFVFVGSLGHRITLSASPRARNVTIPQNALRPLRASRST